ncbi:uncharacterized protein LOC123701788 [Colias croceus]|uniref:uncharacterized protein LOC123701788 n=1 Tax=Colias crocea TaxID=72248 RepID=UPI001E27C1A9|nr:uncharacterized protein LOC123701788 [Colias croceus]
MDIRKFFKGTLKRKKAETSSESSDDEKKEESSLALAQAGSFRVQNTPEVAADEFVCDNDLGKWVGRTSLMTTSQKLDMLKRCWVPPENYDFSKDAKAADLQRKFNHSWLQTYSPWLVYSKHLKGALCLYCVLFPPKTVVGVLGSFVIRPFCCFKYIHEYCVKHVSSQYHKSAVTDAKHLSEKMPVDIMMNTAHQKEIETNKKILASIISSVIFCGTRDLPLRGKQNHEGILEDLLNLKIESGDQDLKKHLERGKKMLCILPHRYKTKLLNCAVWS